MSTEKIESFKDLLIALKDKEPFEYESKGDYSFFSSSRIFDMRYKQSYASYEKETNNLYYHPYFKVPSTTDEKIFELLSKYIKGDVEIQDVTSLIFGYNKLQGHETREVVQFFTEHVGTKLKYLKTADIELSHSDELTVYRAEHVFLVGSIKYNFICSIIGADLNVNMPKTSSAAKSAVLAVVSELRNSAMIAIQMILPDKVDEIKKIDSSELKHVLYE